ncbi:unnamed protein product [Bursaphelenchus okinawaensis]|uniref:Protection of telomeres protein 1 ssDNA-binding domain-containing protein n=1 Tax=Bursaphelenchus okinawaensis TaxID=465554 RepID=A0A811KGF1_9BILA|nr:unnamed protein product [Bursaphelenchus okinawaensis]CAG9102435.1 unnamed protein product [Bursaphelenchus okinawaensis]
MGSFLLLKNLKEVSEAEFIVCAVDSIHSFSTFHENENKGTAILHVIDKSVNEPVECWLMHDAENPFYGGICVGMVLCLHNVTIDHVNEKPVIIVDPVEDIMCRCYGFTLLQNELNCILCYTNVNRLEKVICSGEEKRMRGVRQFLNDTKPNIVVDVKRTLFVVEVREYDQFLKSRRGIKRRNEIDPEISEMLSDDDDIIHVDVKEEQSTNNENVDPFLSFNQTEVVQVPVERRPRPQYEFNMQLTLLCNTISCRYYNIACQIVGVYQRGASTVLRVTDGTVVKRELISAVGFETEGTLSKELADRFADRTYDIDVYDEYTEQAKLFAPNDLVVVVNVHTYINQKNGEMLTLHRNGGRFNRGIYELKADSNIGMALLRNLANPPPSTQRLR